VNRESGTSAVVVEASFGVITGDAGLFTFIQYGDQPGERRRSLVAKQKFSLHTFDNGS
jgi:hypothetical protein